MMRRRRNCFGSALKVYGEVAVTGPLRACKTTGTAAALSGMAVHALKFVVYSTV